MSLNKLYIYSLVAIVALGISGGVAYLYFHTPAPLTVAVSRGTVVQKVSVTGKTQAAQEVELGFQMSGRVVRVQAKAGERVEVGQPVVELDSRELRASLDQAKASRDSGVAVLKDLQSGTPAQDITVAQARVASADVAVKDTQNNVQSALLRAYAKAADVVYNSTDQLFSSPKTNPDLLFLTYNDQTKAGAIQQRKQLEALLSGWAVKLSSSLGGQELESLTASNLSVVQAYLNGLTVALNSAIVGGSVTLTMINTWQAGVSVAQTTISAEVANMQSATQARNAARTALQVAQAELASKQAGNTEASIEAQQAKVKQLEAQIASIEAQLSHTTLVSPIMGTVTRQDAKVGQIAAGGAPVTAISSDSQLEIQAYVPEISIGKVAVGNQVEIVFDAFPNELFEGSVTYIDPAETVIQGVSNYKIKVSLSKNDTRLRSGLTANLDVVSGSKENVLLVPQYAIHSTEQGPEVDVYIDKAIQRKQITVGMIGVNGLVEVLSGLTEGDAVVVPFAQN